MIKANLSSMLLPTREQSRGCMVGENLGNSQPPSAPVATQFNGWSGRFRVYWNGTWIIDNGSALQKIEAEQVRFVNPGVLRTGVSWIEGVGIVKIENGVAVIWRA